MYKNGEIEQVMASFEKSLQTAPIYVGAAIERSERVEIELDNGRYAKRYVNNQYYDNGTVNNLFIMFLHGYASGKNYEIN